MGKIFFIFISLLSSFSQTIQLDKNQLVTVENFKTDRLEDLVFFEEIINKNDILQNSLETKTFIKKPYTALVYIAGDNDLRSFVARNIQQMSEIGSNQNINLLIHLDIRMTANQKITKRYLVKGKDEIIPMNNNDILIQSMDSGDPETLISAVQWAAENYPAENYILILWNHGSGIIDPGRYRMVNPASLFIFNPLTHMFDLNRAYGFIDLIEEFPFQLDRGICWDDTTHNYLTNQKLQYALDHIYNNILHQKFAIIGFDACLMSMIEIAKYLKPYANFMIGSQEVELGSGWNYKSSFAPFLTGAPKAEQLAQHIIKAYEETYFNITNDYTLSAINLNKIDSIENNINQLALLFLQAIEIDTSYSVIQAIKKAANPQYCTHFEEPSYIDIYHFYTNLETNLTSFKINNQQLINNIKNTLELGKKLIKKAVIASKAGKNFQCAQGLSIYFPTNKIHPSYPKTTFFKENFWSKILQICL